MPEMERRIFTFGGGQPHFPGYVVVYGVDPAQCRARMTKRFGFRWASEYLSEADAGVARWKLPLIATIGEPDHA